MNGLTTINFHRAVSVEIETLVYESFYANRFCFQDVDGNRFEFSAFSDTAAIAVTTLPTRLIDAKAAA